MKIKRNSWSAYVKALGRLDDKAMDLVKRYIKKTGWQQGDDTRDLIRFANKVASTYGEGASSLSCEMYDEMATMSGAYKGPAAPASVPTYGDVAKAINGTAKIGNPDVMAASIGRLVKQTGVDTTMQNALRDGAEWAWVPNGDTCAYCIALASRGWQKASEKALKNGHAEHIHANCDCSYAIRFDGKSTVEGYDPDKYREQYESAGGNTWLEKVNTMRREQDKERPLKNRVKDVTKEWHERASKNPPSIKYMKSVMVDGEEYSVDGINVKLNPDKNEKRIAKLLTDKLGGLLEVWPTITLPENKQTPDYIFYGNRTDLKTPTKTNKDTLYNACHKKKKQANNFVFDISNIEMDRQEAIEQAEALFRRKGTGFVERVFLVDGDEIFKIFEKNKK